MSLCIDIESNRFKCHIELLHRISVIIGDSGVGKTAFVRALLDTSGGYKVKYNQRIRVVLLTESVLSLLSEVGSLKERTLFIVDDDDFILSAEAGEIISTVTNAYFVFIVRTTKFDRGIRTQNHFSISGDAVYCFVKDGKDHRLIKALYSDTENHTNVVADYGEVGR